MDNFTTSNDIVSYEFEEPEVTPQFENYTFEDLIYSYSKQNGINDLQAINILKRRVYPHQRQVFEYLRKGYNVILTSPTGSGKTEAWLLYVLNKLVKGGNIRVLLLYPTRSLSNDQYVRLSNYSKIVYPSNAFGLEKPHYYFVRKYDYREGTTDGQILDAAKAKIIISNPEKIAKNLHNKPDLNESTLSRLTPFDNIDLIVIDEFDFYGVESGNKLLLLLKVLYKDIFKKDFPQYVIMSATLRGISEAQLKSSILGDLNKRDIVVINGIGRRPKNKVKLILGPSKYFNNIPKEKIFEELEKYFYGEKYDKEIIDTIKSAIREFNKSYLISFLKSLLEPNINTLVFCPTINIANKLYHTMKPNDNDNRILIHHSLISENERVTVEKRLRDEKGLLVFTVLTLRQGIDVKSVNRVVHYGMPTEVTEYLQREGRKGRGDQVKFTETIIIPRSIKDLLIFSDKDPRQSFSIWLSLGPETTILYNKGSPLASLIERLYKCVGDDSDECKDMKKIAQKLKILNKQRNIKGNTNTEQYYGSFYSWDYKSIPVEIDEYETALKVNPSVAINYYQPGCIDFSTSGIVVSTERNKIKEVLIENLCNNESEEKLKVLIENYKNKRGLNTSDCKTVSNKILEDIYSGALFSVVKTSIYLEEKIDNNTDLWIVKIYPKETWWYLDFNGVFLPVGRKTIKSRLYVYGVTYAYEFPLAGIKKIVSQKGEEKFDFYVELERLLTLFQVVLRISYGIQYPFLSFYVDEQQNKFKIWENEPLSILEVLFKGNSLLIGNKVLDLNNVLKEIDNLSFDKKVRLLLRMQGHVINQGDFEQMKYQLKSFLVQLSKFYAYKNIFEKYNVSSDVLFLSPTQDFIYFSKDIFPQIINFDVFSNKSSKERQEKEKEITEITKKLIEDNQYKEVVLFRLKDRDNYNNRIINFLNYLRKEKKINIIEIQDPIDVHFDDDPAKNLIEEVLKAYIELHNKSHMGQPTVKDTPPYFIFLVSDNWSKTFKPENISKKELEITRDTIIFLDGKSQNINYYLNQHLENIKRIINSNTFVPINVIFVNKENNVYYITGFGEISNKNDIRVLNDGSIDLLKVTLKCMLPNYVNSKNVPEELKLNINYIGKVLLFGETNNQPDINSKNIEKVSNFVNMIRNNTTKSDPCLTYVKERIIKNLPSEFFANEITYYKFKGLISDQQTSFLLHDNSILIKSYTENYLMIYENNKSKFFIISIPNQCSNYVNSIYSYTSSTSNLIKDLFSCLGLSHLMQGSVVDLSKENQSVIRVLGGEVDMKISTSIENVLSELHNQGILTQFITEKIDISEFKEILQNFSLITNILRNSKLETLGEIEYLLNTINKIATETYNKYTKTKQAILHELKIDEKELDSINLNNVDINFIISKLNTLAKSPRLLDDLIKYINENKKLISNRTIFLGRNTSIKAEGYWITEPIRYKVILFNNGNIIVSHYEFSELEQVYKIPTPAIVEFYPTSSNVQNISSR